MVELDVRSGFGAVAEVRSVGILVPEVAAPPLDRNEHAALPSPKHAPQLLLQPAIQTELTAALWEYPPTEDFFEAIRRPRKAGKAYVEPESESVRELAGQVGAPEQGRLWNSDPRERKSTPSVTPNGKAPTIDVFDLLLPFLLPPVESLLQDNVILPSGQRPHPYQVEGVRFLAERQSALLGDEMGLGKTVQAILAFRLLHRKRLATRALVVCPRSLLDNWENEIRDWAPGFMPLTVRGPQEVRDKLWTLQFPFLITTYETLRDDITRNPAIANLFGENKIQLVICDEIQKIKNPNSQVARGIRRTAARYRWGLSATPLENKVEDVVAVFGYLKPDLFRRSSPPYQPMAVRRAIAPYFLRRRVQDADIELPEKIIRTVELELTPAQRASYNQARSRSRATLSQPGATRVHVLAQINELKQICNRDEATGSSCKLEYLVEQLEKITDAGQKALVFSQYPERTLRQILSELRPFGAEVYDGSLSDRERNRILSSFREELTPKVLLMSLKAGGLGLNLEVASHVFHFDHWWNPAVSRQAEGRAHRQGKKQQPVVFVHDIYTRDTVEEWIRDKLIAKGELFASVIDDLATESQESQLTIEELFGFFDLKPPDSLRREPGQAPGAKSASPQPAGPQLHRPDVAHWLDDLSPMQFEKCVAALYQKLGYAVRLTPGSHDGGVDIDARRMAGSHEERMCIQCKHYPRGSVGVSVVREAIGVLAANPRLNGAVIVTSGRFSSGAIDLARRHRVELVDGAMLTGLLRRHRIPGPDLGR